MDVSPAGKLYLESGYQHSLSEWREVIKGDYTEAWQHLLAFLNDSVPRKSVLFEFARGTKLRPGCSTHWLLKLPCPSEGTFWKKAENSFTKMQIPEAKELWESTKKNCGDGRFLLPTSMPSLQNKWGKKCVCAAEALALLLTLK